MNIRILRSVVMLTALIAGAVSAAGREESGSEPLERSLARLVNQHALPAHMIVGRLVNDVCVLKLDHDFTRSLVAEEAAAQERVFRELELSNIEQDIRRFNAPRTTADEALFQLDRNCAPLEYVPQIAEFRPPSATDIRAFTVRYPSQQAVESIEVEVTLPARQKTYRLPVLRRQSPDVASELDLAAPRGPIYIGEEDLVLKWNRQVLVDWSLGRWPLLRSFRLDPNTRMRVRAGSSVVESDAATAKAGSKIVFPEGAVLTLLKYNRRGEPTIQAQVSWRQVKASNVLYQIDEHGNEYWGKQPTNFEAQIVRSLRAQRSVRPEVTLSFSPELNDELRAILKRAVEATGDPDGVYASVAMMDADTGDFIGVAGLPTARDTPRSLPGEAFVPDEHFREEFLRRRPIGSVAKAPIAYAIISTAPALAELRLAPYTAGAQKSILGIELDKDFNDPSNGANCEQIDFECFLKKSLNRYAATLITLAAVPRLDADNSLQLLGATNGKRLGRDAFWIGKPGLMVEQQPRGLIWTRTPSAEQLLGLGWVRYVKDNYNIDVSLHAGSGYIASTVHNYMWRDAVDISDPMSMQMVSPEKENLRLDQARYLRADYLTLILGGGESMWSSTKVAEVFARTITGHRIQGSFVLHDRLPTWRSMPGPAISKAREHYLAGLSQVFTPSGTGAGFAKKVSGLVARAKSARLELLIYAKSGTPSITQSEEGARHPIDQAFSTGVLGAIKTPQGSRIYLRDRQITAELAERFQPEPSSQLTRKHLEYLALFNSFDAEKQADMCDLQGGTLSCEWQERTDARARKGEGRNYVVYARLRDPVTQGTCRAVSMAVSFSRQKGNAFARMLNELLDPSTGPLSRLLGLDDLNKPVECARAS